MMGGGGVTKRVQRTITTGAGGSPVEPFSPSSNASTAIAKTTNSKEATNFNREQPVSPNPALTISNADNGSGKQLGLSWLINFPASGGSSASSCGHSSSSICSDESNWECVDEIENGMTAPVFQEYFDLLTSPTRDELEKTVYDLRRVIGPMLRVGSSKGSAAAEGGGNVDVAEEAVNPIGSEKKACGTEAEMDWIEPSLDISYSRELQAHRSDEVYNAFYLLQTEPSVQQMVTSLSSDRAVWNAVMNNEVIKELSGSFTQGLLPKHPTVLQDGCDVNTARNKTVKTSQPRARKLQVEEDESSGKDCDDDENTGKDILGWVMANAQAKIKLVADWMVKLVYKAFQLPNNAEKGDKSRENRGQAESNNFPFNSGALDRGGHSNSECSRFRSLPANMTDCCIT